MNLGSSSMEDGFSRPQREHRSQPLPGPPFSRLIKAEQTKDRGALIIAFWTATREHMYLQAEAAAAQYAEREQEEPSDPARRHEIDPTRAFEADPAARALARRKIEPLLAQIKIMHPEIAEPAQQMYEASRVWKHIVYSDLDQAVATVEFERAARAYLTGSKYVKMPAAEWTRVDSRGDPPTT